MWEEERGKRSLVKWAGEDGLDMDKTGNLRRAPTPFPKEMRAMAKKVQSMKEKRGLETDERNSKRRSTREYKSRNNRQRLKDVDEYDRAHPNQQQHQQQSVVAAATALASKLQDTAINNNADNHATADKVSRDSGVISPSDNGVDDTDTDNDHENLVDNASNNMLQVHDNPTSVNNQANGYLPPVKAELVTNELDDVEEEMRAASGAGHQQQPPPYHIAATRSKHAGSFYNIHQPQMTPPSPAAAAINQQEEHFYENQASYFY